jgi:hypothetical protein
MLSYIASTYLSFNLSCKLKLISRVDEWGGAVGGVSL